MIVVYVMEIMKVWMNVSVVVELVYPMVLVIVKEHMKWDHFVVEIFL
jgi:hypothetical protein